MLVAAGKFDNCSSTVSIDEAGFVAQLSAGRVFVRTIDSLDVDDSVVSYNELQAAGVGKPAGASATQSPFT